MSARQTHALSDARVAPSEPADASEPTLVEYLRLLLTRWPVILALAVVGGAAGFLVSTFAAPSYRAIVTLELIGSTPGAQPDPIQITTFQTLLLNRGTMADTIARFGLDEPPYDLGPAEFATNVVDVQPVPQTPLLRLSVSLPDPELAAAVANDISTRGLALAEEQEHDETARAQAGLEAQFDEARRRLEVVEAELQQVKEEGQLDVLRSDVEVLLDQRRALQELEVSIANERARLAAAEADLASRQPVDVRTGAAGSDGERPAISEDVTPTELMGLSFMNDRLNQTYRQLDQEAAQIRRDLSGLEQERAQLVSTVGLDEPELARLSELYALETRVARLELDLEVAREVYVSVATEYERARTEAASRSPQVQIVDPALVPQTPLPRFRSRNTALGAVAGLLAGLIIVILPTLVPETTSREPAGA